jgi:hypothetical protein
MGQEGKEIVKRHKLETCLNCSQSLMSQNYCPNCGQENSNRNLSVWILLGDFMRDYFSFDAKLFRTLVPLMIKPGRVPKEFIEGKRVRHIPPFRILIFTSFLFFFIWGITFDSGSDGDDRVSSMVNQGLDSLNSATEGKDVQAVILGNDMANFQLTNGDLDEESGTQMKIEQIKLLVDKGFSVKQAVDSVAVDNTVMEKKLYTQIAKIYTSDKSTLVKYFIGNLSLIILVIQPFFAFLLWLIYVRKRKKYRYIQHLIFSFYFHAWALVMCTVGVLLQQIFKTFDLASFMLAISGLYILVGMKYFYEQNWLKTILKTALVGILYLGLIIPTFLVISFLVSFYFF